VTFNLNFKLNFKLKFQVPASPFNYFIVTSS